MAVIDNRKPENNEIKHYRGDLFDEVWNVTKDDGTAYDMSGKTVVLTIRKQSSFNSNVEKLTTADGTITVSGTSNNELVFSKVINLKPRLYFYDVEVSSDNYTISCGTWCETQDVTR